MRVRFAIILLLAMSACGGGETREVNVSLDVSDADCKTNPDCHTEHLSGTGIVVPSSTSSGLSTFYAELKTSNDALAMIEIVYGDGSTATVRYRELKQGEL